MTSSEATDRGFRMEIIRKTIHLSSISIPGFYFFTPRETALSVAVILTALALAIDLGRLHYPPMTLAYNKIFGPLLRSHESRAHSGHLTGATYVLIAATLSILIFPKLIAITSFLVLILADMAAALVGKKFGTRPFLGKSVQGSGAFFVVALVIMGATPKVNYETAEYVIGCFAAITGTVIEALPLRVDDNLSIPLSVGFALWAGYGLFCPHLDIYRFG